jgi:alpha/beta superfamily hydrolase
MTAGASAPRLASIDLRGPAGRLEALLQERHPGNHDVTAVVLHPHPLYGGTMHNKVVHRVAGTLHELGAAVLRFNFRGVSKSEGQHDRGDGEVEDARAALAFVAERWPHARRWLAGFSFGSWIAARLAVVTPEIERLLLVAPPVTTSSFAVMHTAAVPKLVIQGTRDDVCPFDRLVTEYAAWAPPKKLVTVEGAGHFFDRRLDALATAVRQLMTEPVG